MTTEAETGGTVSTRTKTIMVTGVKTVGVAGGTVIEVDISGDRSGDRRSDEESDNGKATVIATCVETGG